MERHHVLFIIAAVLMIAGIVMMTWREPAARQEIDGEERVVETNDDVQPYFWPGAIVFVAGAVAGGWAFQRYRRPPESANRPR